MEIFLKIINLYIIICFLYIAKPMLLFKDGKTKQFGLGCCRTMFSMEFLIVVFAIML